MSVFDNSCEEISKSKAFVDIATAGIHRGLSTAYIKRNLFHQIKIGRDVVLQNTHIVLFKSPRDVMQVSTLSAQLGLVSKLADWHRDATSVPYGHLLIDLSRRTDDRSFTCTNTRSMPSKIYIPDLLKQSKVLDDEHTKSFYCPCVPNIFQQMQKSFPSVSPKRVYPFFCECIIILLKGNSQSIKRHHVTKFYSKMRVLSQKRTTWKQRRDILASDKGLQLIKVITFPVINHLS